MDEDYYNWIHFPETEASMDDYGYPQAGDKAKLTRGPLRNREVTLLWWFPDTEIWSCSLVIDGVEMEFDVNESDLEVLDNGQD